jgi:hypothetical protein
MLGAAVIVNAFAPVLVAYLSGLRWLVILG